ncbi:flagellar assembly peptidoglycan hydrolase FlgJ [Calidifontimicrobium sp. SYSU G02091]|uniref:flagellar assembly peptidoglycan hydrolase FlgJ n=1 Tax=Calidifontimicrobium sp. SYSU G02091 TaxID=2926421 RepID=UPI001F532098|nr:flagellar assembly peptidoglycan hydrolase FlgJ [Calidifontimicrobium sp. SYSU G02091]MCI1191196.1 flagellar assembly peptidoglycan hydrolase FlgJ [Calidifontimicrobium sp. SYSU G02091]
MALAPLPGLATDARSVDGLRTLASRDPQAAVKEVAKQFESLFMQELLKSMRQATMNSGLLDNSASELGTEMLDAQYAQKMSGLPGGLADVIARQIARQMGLPADARTAAPAVPAAAPGTTVTPAAATDAAAPRPARAASGDSRHEFIARHEQAAKAAEAATGIPATFLLAQAALETGWGRRDIRMADGTPSHNVFGIKATPGWSGPVAEVTTTEYLGGVARKVKARFRAYASVDEAFADYARLMTRSKRYAQVLAQAQTAHGFAQGLQRAGYATDPAYATKLASVIDTTLRVQRTLSA